MLMMKDLGTSPRFLAQWLFISTFLHCLSHASLPCLDSRDLIDCYGSDVYIGIAPMLLCSKGVLTSESYFLSQSERRRYCELAAWVN